MGNKAIVEEQKPFDDEIHANLKYIKKLYDDRYGEFKLMQIIERGVEQSQIINNPTEYMNISNISQITKEKHLILKTKIYGEKNEAMKAYEMGNIRTGLTIESIIRLHKVKFVEVDEYCSNFFKVHLIYEYLDRTLEDQIEEYKEAEKYFEQIELLNVLDCIISALVSFATYKSYPEEEGILQNDNYIKHEDIRPHTIFLSNEGIYKINDIQFMSELTQYKQLLIGCCEKLYLSPELFKMLRIRDTEPDLDYQKNDVFSLGLTILEAATLSSVQEIYDFDNFSINEEKLSKLFEEMKRLKYSDEFIELLDIMLAINPEERPNFHDILGMLTPILEDIKRNEESQQPSSHRKEKSKKAGRFEKNQKIDINMEEINTKFEFAMQKSQDVQTKCKQLLSYNKEIKDDEIEEIIMKTEEARRNLDNDDDGNEMLEDNDLWDSNKFYEIYLQEYSKLANPK